MSNNIILFGGSNGLGKNIKNSLSLNKKNNIYTFGVSRPQKKEKSFFFKCDLKNFYELKKCISYIRNNIKKVDVLILNSGLIENKKRSNKIFYDTFLVNYLSQFYIVYKLKNNILKSKKKRVIVISSHVIKNVNQSDLELFSFKKEYSYWHRYKLSKILLFLSLSYFKDFTPKINIIFFNPGRMQTNILDKIFLLKFFSKIFFLLLGKNPKISAHNIKKIVDSKKLPKKIFYDFNLKDIKKLNFLKRKFSRYFFLKTKKVLKL